MNKKTLIEFDIFKKTKSKEIQVQTKDGKILNLEISYIGKDGNELFIEVKPNKYEVKKIEVIPEKNEGRMFYTNSSQIIPIKIMKTNGVNESKKQQAIKKEASKPGVKGKAVVGVKKLHEEDETEEHEEKSEKEEKKVGEKMKESKKIVKVSRQRIEEVIKLIKRIQQLTGKKVQFGSLIKEDPKPGAQYANKKAQVIDPWKGVKNTTPSSKTEIEESKKNKVNRIKELVKIIESKTGKKVVFEELKKIIKEEENNPNKEKCIRFIVDKLKKFFIKFPGFKIEDFVNQLKHLYYLVNDYNPKTLEEIADTIYEWESEYQVFENNANSIMDGLFKDIINEWTDDNYRFYKKVK